MINKKGLVLLIVFVIICVYCTIWSEFHTVQLHEREVMKCREDVCHFLEDQANCYTIYLQHKHFYDIVMQDGERYCIEFIARPYMYAYKDGWCYVEDQETKEKRKFQYEWDFSLCESLQQEYPKRILQVLRDEQYPFEGELERNFFFFLKHRYICIELDPPLLAEFGLQDKNVIAESTLNALRSTLSKKISDSFIAMRWDIPGDGYTACSNFEVGISEEDIETSLENKIGPLEEYTICTDEEQIALYKKGMLPLNEAYMPTFT